MIDFNLQPHDKPAYIIIAAAPRSGTRYMAEVLQAVDLDVRHEAFGKHGISAFYIIPHLSVVEHGTILHQVRHPLKAISSMQSILKSWTYIREYTGIHPDNGGCIHACMKLWQLLNMRIEPYAQLRYRVEDIEDAWPAICDVIGVEKIAIPDIPKDVHTRQGKYRPLAWHELEFRDAALYNYIRGMSARYGYED